jgi:short-subunit dehydrogenase
MMEEYQKKTKTMISINLLAVLQSTKSYTQEIKNKKRQKSVNHVSSIQARGKKF